MDPVTIAAIGAPIAAGAVGMYNSEQTRKANAADRRRIAEMVDAIQDPTFDLRQLNPEEFRLLETYAPEVASYVAEKDPQLVKALGEGAQAGREAQLAALRDLLKVAISGEDPIAELQRQRAMRDAMGQQNRERQNIEMSMQRRGIGGGSGLGLAARLQSNAAAQQTAALQGEQAAANAQQSRLQAMNQASSLGGQLYNQDVDLERTNAGIINDFNRRMAAAQNDYNRYRADAFNQGNLRNIEARQGIADRNTALRNQTQQYNREYGNRMAQNQYANAMDRVGMKTGNINAGMQDRLAGTAQQNAAMLGIGQGVSSGAQYYQSGQRADRAQENDQKRLDMERERLEMERKRGY